MLENIPLLGALCMAAGLISEAQLAVCLQLQQQKYHGASIGQILVLRGYLSQQQLARMAAQQRAFRRTFCAAIEQAAAFAIGEAAATAMPGATSSVNDVPRASAMPELALFAEAEIDASPLFNTRR
jgi:hypothetical protein